MLHELVPADDVDYGCFGPDDDNLSPEQCSRGQVAYSVLLPTHPLMCARLCGVRARDGFVCAALVPYRRGQQRHRTAPIDWWLAGFVKHVPS